MVMSLGDVWPDRENLSISRRRLAQPAGALLAQCFVEQGIGFVRRLVGHRHPFSR